MVNWGLYDEDAIEQVVSPVSKISADEPKTKKPESSVNWGLYDDQPPVVDNSAKAIEASGAKDKLYQQYKTQEKTPEQIKQMTASEKRQYVQDLKTEREYLQSAGFVKSALSEATFGATEKADLLKPQEHELNQGLGSFVGMTAPLGVLGALIKTPVNIVKATRLGKKLISASGLVENLALTGGAFEAGKQIVKGEGVDPKEIANTGLEFGAIGALFEAAPVAWNWLKSLNPSKQAQILVDGTIPPDLPPTQYKFYQDEVVPELRKIAESEYTTALEEATQKTNADFEQKMSNVKAQHEKDLYELNQKQQLSEEAQAKYDQDYQNRIKQIAAEHEAELDQLEKVNNQAIQEYEKSKVEWERTKSRQAAVENAIKSIPEESPEKLTGRVFREGEDVGLRPQSAVPQTTTLKDRVGSVISKDKIKNTYDAGQKNVKAVRASDEADYRVVRDLYEKSEQLNNEVEAIQPNLANELRFKIEEIKAIPDPSPPQKQVLSTAEKTLNALIEFDEFGNAVGFKPVNNRVLLEQAKALRYSQDYDFSHGNSTGIFKPVINSLEDAAEIGAISVGNTEAVEANQAARQAYREWADLYQNDLIRNYRNSSNHKYSQTFDSSLNVDDFIQLDKVLSRTNAGQQLSAQTRRELITKKLNPFFENPRKVNPEKFNEALAELSPVLQEGEEQAIRSSFNQARQTPVIEGKKLQGIEPPKEPKIKSIDKVRIPRYKPPRKPFQEITQVEIPLKPKVKPTPEMKLAAKKMNIEPEQAIKLTDTPTGFKKLKTDLSKTESGQQLFREIGKRKVKDIFFQGKVKHKFTGGELSEILNKGDNFNILSEILGEEATLDLLESSTAIAEKRMTIESLKKYAKKMGTVKAALLFGII